MDLTYEETMRRIEEFEKNDILKRKLPREKKKPYHVDIYQGEGQMIVVPLVDCTNGLRVQMAKFWTMTDLTNAQQIGDIVQEAFAYIQVRPIDARTRAEKEADSVRANATTCKSYNTFCKKYMMCTVVYMENGSYAVTSTFNHGQLNSEYEVVDLPKGASALDIGAEVIKGFAKIEAYCNMAKKQPPSRPRITFDTLSGAKFSFETLPEDGYEDEEDYGVAEIYQGYSYYKESDDESVADIYFSIAAELDCDISAENVQAVYGKRYGADANIEITQITHPIFEKRIEVISKKIHHITYVKQVDENELLACELELKVKPAGKRIYAKILKDFEKLVESSKIE